MYIIELGSITKYILSEVYLVKSILLDGAVVKM